MVFDTIFFMRYIAKRYLQDEEAIEATKSILENAEEENILQVYIDRSFSSRERSFIRNLIQDTDDIIGLDFEFTNNKNRADINFSQVGNFRKGELGYTGINHNDQWDVVINRNQSSSDKRWSIVHQLGYALGLENPSDDYDGDYFVTRNAFSIRGATSDDTVMSFKQGRKSYDPSFWTANDQDALVSIWGTS